MPRWNMELERTPLGARHLLASWWASELRLTGVGPVDFREARPVAIIAESAT